MNTNSQNTRYQIVYFSFIEMTAIIFLTRATPLPSTLTMASDLANIMPADVYIMCDQLPTERKDGKSPKVNLLHYSDEEARAKGFKSATATLGKEVTAWDKMLLFVCQLRPDYQFVWVIEDDVGFLGPEVFQSLSKYQGDLICASHDLNTTGQRGWHWKRAKDMFPLPWAKSMVCCVGLSRTLLTHVDDLVRTKGKLAFVELMFNTIALQQKLIILNPEELSTIVFRRNWTLAKILSRPHNLYHPVKSDFMRLQLWTTGKEKTEKKD